MLKIESFNFHKMLSLCFVLTIVCSLQTPAPAEQQERAPSPAEIVPVDTLMYAHIPQPVELWTALQGTELREAIKSSFISEVAVNFIIATVNLYSSSFIGSPLGEAVERYDLEFALAFAPPPPDSKGTPPYAVIVQPAKNTHAFKEGVTRRGPEGLRERFPNIEIATEVYGGKPITLFTFSRKTVWAMAFFGDRMVIGDPEAVVWMAVGRHTLANDAGFTAARERFDADAQPSGVFCFSRITPLTGETNPLFSTDAVIAGVLQVRDRLIHDRVVVFNNHDAPRTGRALPPSIPPILAKNCSVTQLALASGSEILHWFGMRPHGLIADVMNEAFTGLTYNILTGGAEPQQVLALRIASKEAVPKAMQLLGLNEHAAGWGDDLLDARIIGDTLYLGTPEGVRRVISLMSSAKGAEFAPSSDRAAHAWIEMPPSFLASLSWASEIKPVMGILNRLSPSRASAIQTDGVLRIQSLSPHGFGIWLHTLNLESARAASKMQDDEEQETQD